jgi:hypothetical protein
VTVTSVGRVVVGGCPKVAGTWHLGQCECAWWRDIGADTACADQCHIRIGLGLARRQLSDAGRASRARSGVGLARSTVPSFA